MIEISLLGPSAIVCDGQALRPPIRKAMTLLAFLAVERKARRDELAERMWPGLDVASARRNLRRELARLRDAGLREAIAADDERIVLADTVRIDVDAFLRGVADGDARAALALWRGPFAQDIVSATEPWFSDWAEAQRSRLVAARRQALERVAAAAEAAGDRHAALESLQAALADDPLQERLHREAMRLLAALGEREQALAQYERCCQVLEDELGIAPLAETEALARSLRSSGPVGVPGAHRDEATPMARAPAGPVADSAGMLPHELPFVGRADEIESLEAAWRAGVVVVVVGPGGVGKSRLAADFVAARTPPLLVACRAGDEGVAYRSASRMLRALVAAGGPPEEAWVLSELARLLPEIGPAPPPLADEMQSLRFLDAMARAVAALAADNFGALVLDDLHLADAASAALFGHIAGRLRDEAAEGRAVPRLVVTLREGEGAAAIDALVASLVAAGTAQRVAIAPLGPADVLDLVRRLSGAAAPSRFAARLHGATAGNAFFVHETLRHLVATGWLGRSENGVWRTPLDERTNDYAELPLPTSVFEATAARVDRGGDGTRRVLEAASLAGEPFEIDTLSGATALSPLEVAEVLERAEAMQLVVATGGGVRFAHDLVRQALASRLSLERRRLLHARLAAAAERAEAEPAIVGEHWFEAGKPGRAVTWWLRAAERAAERWADVDAIALYRRALAAGITDAEALPAQRALSRLHYRRNEVDPALAAARAALALAEQQADPDTAALVAAALADIEVGVHRIDEASSRLDELASRPGLLATTRARIELSRCEAWRQQGRHGEARGAALAVLSLLDGAADASGAAAPPLVDDLRGDAHEAVGIVALLGGDLHEGIAHAQAMREICVRLGDASGIGKAERMLGVMLVNLNTDRGRARLHLEAARRVAAAERDVTSERVTILNLIKIAGDAGDDDEVLALAEAGWNLSPRFARAMLRHAFLFAFVYTHLLRGELGKALDRAAMVRAEADGSTEFLTSSLIADQLADVYLCVGDTAALHAMFDAIPPASGAGANHRLRLSVVRAAAYLISGDIDAARKVLDGWPDEPPDVAIEARAQLMLHRAELARRESRLNDAWREFGRVGELSNRELAMTAAALHLRLAASGGRPASAEGAPESEADEAEAAIVQARALLAEGRAPVSFVLDLRIALVGTLEAAGFAAEAASERAGVRAELARLVASLGAHADRREAFLARYPLS
ncbi:MAG: AAA family ATPase [Burkholderiales bacterium]|nr:AAA family ATPase [Burkholderiales bacterium]